MQQINKKLTDNQARAVVEAADADFNKKLYEVARSIISSPVTIKVIALCGPTCAGKTTTANRLTTALQSHGKLVYTVSIDDYYFDRQLLIERSDDGKIDFDSPDTIDIDALAVTVREIFDDTKADVEIPVYDFKSGTRSGIRTISDDDNAVYIFEGIQALYPNVLSLFESYPSTSIFISVTEGLDAGDVSFDHNEIRLLRRTVRDYYRRSATPEYSFMLWRGVRENEDKNIYPCAHLAKYSINSVMKYEIGMLKPYLERILPQVPKDNEYFDFAQRLLFKIRDFSPIDKQYLAADSLYHEFI